MSIKKIFPKNLPYLKIKYLSKKFITYNITNFLIILKKNWVYKVKKIFNWKQI